MTTHGKRHAKQDIMDAAWKLFTEQGYDETTIAQIIELFPQHLLPPFSWKR